MHLAPWTRRRFALATAGAALVGRAGAAPRPMLTLYTFGDSILDCGHYNPHGVHPGALVVRNDDRLFPAWRGRDLGAVRPGRLAHHAVDGATVQGLAAQARGVQAQGAGLVLLTAGGNDLLRGLAADTGPGLRAFEATLSAFLRGLQDLRLGPVLVGNVYDPTLGDDSRNFLGIDPRIARANHRRVNDVLAAAAHRHGALVDLHAHFLRGGPDWFTHTIEPSLEGASQVRAAFWPAVQKLAGAA